MVARQSRTVISNVTGSTSNVKDASVETAGRCDVTSETSRR